jgi:hypothetical protein
VQQLDGVRMAQLMRREPQTHAWDAVRNDRARHAVEVRLLRWPA